MDYIKSSNSFGIHTFMLTAPLSYEKYRDIKTVYQKNVWEKKETDNQSYIKTKFFMNKGFFGVSSRLYMQNGFARIEIIVNPTDLLEEQYTQIGIISSDFSKEMLFKLSRALKLIDMTLNDFTLSRVDLCVNLIMSPAAVETYIKLSKRSYLSRNMKEKQFADANDNSHSLTLVCPSFEIEIYDKEYEIASRVPEYELAGEYGHILRLEVRLSRDTIYNYVSSRHLCGLREILSFFILNSRDIMRYYIKYSFLQGDYVTLESAKQIIDLKHFKEQTKKRMFYILDSRKPIEERFDDLACVYNLSPIQITRLKNKFEKIGICPVTLPVRDSHKAGSYLTGISNLASKGASQGQ